MLAKAASTSDAAQLMKRSSVLLKGLMSVSKLVKKRKMTDCYDTPSKVFGCGRFLSSGWFVLITASIMNKNICGNNIQLFIACFISVMMSYVKLSCGTK